MPEQPRPFASRKLTWRERRAMERRAAARAAARAKAMPPPEPGTRVDPITGRLSSGPAPSPAPRPTGAPSPSSSPQPAKAPRRRIRPAVQPVAPDAPAALPSLAAVAARASRPSLRSRVWTSAGEDAAVVNLCAGSVLLLLGLMVGLGMGAPVLNRPGWLLEPLLAAAGLVGVGVVLVRRGFPSARLRARLVALGLSGLLGASFTVGVFADPVIVEGRVLLNTSAEAKSARLADSVYTDLRRMAALDRLLAADLADARSQVSAFDPAVKELVEMSDRYARTSAEDLPDPMFAPIVESMKTASYWESKAMEAKGQLVDQEDARTAADLDTYRASFTSSWLEASSRLAQAGTALGIPITDDLEGPRE